MSKNEPKLSVIITSKDRNDQKLKELEYSLSLQTFRNFETLIVTEGNSETAKAIGLKQAKGEIICVLASDNYLNDPLFFERCLKPLQERSDLIGSFPMRYWYYKYDNILNRYFALFGVNDPIPLYLKKNDRMPYYVETGFGYPLFIFKDKGYIALSFNSIPTLGDNGFFIRRDILMKADIEHYFHIDVCQDLFNLGYKDYAAVLNTSIWHRTGGNVIKFFAKRLKYADKFSAGRRWKMVEKKDLPLLLWFIFSTLTLIFPVYLSMRGYKVIKDKAWFLHLPICFITLFVYGLWTIKNTLKRVLSFAVSTARKA